MFANSSLQSSTCFRKTSMTLNVSSLFNLSPFFSSCERGIGREVRINLLSLKSFSANPLSLANLINDSKLFIFFISSLASLSSCSVISSLLHHLFLTELFSIRVFYDLLFPFFLIFHKSKRHDFLLFETSVPTNVYVFSIFFTLFFMDIFSPFVFDNRRYVTFGFYMLYIRFAIKQFSSYFTFTGLVEYC